MTVNKFKITRDNISKKLTIPLEVKFDPYGRQQMVDAQARALKEFKGKFPLLTTREHAYGAVFPVINRDDARLKRYPEVMEDAELQLQQAEREEWGIYLSTGTKPMEF